MRRSNDEIKAQDINAVSFRAIVALLKAQAIGH